MSSRNPFAGPYTGYGSDAYGHPVNQYGRCAQLNSSPNADPATCPNAADRTSYLSNLTVAQLSGFITNVLNLPLPMIQTAAVMVPLIVNTEVARGITHE